MPDCAALKPQLGLKLGLLKDTAGKLTFIVFGLAGVGFTLGTCRWGADRNDPALGGQVGWGRYVCMCRCVLKEQDRWVALLPTPPAENG